MKHGSRGIENGDVKITVDEPHTNHNTGEPLAEWEKELLTVTAAESVTLPDTPHTKIVASGQLETHVWETDSTPGEWYYSGTQNQVGDSDIARVRSFTVLAEPPKTVGSVKADVQAAYERGREDANAAPADPEPDEDGTVPIARYTGEDGSSYEVRVDASMVDTPAADPEPDDAYWTTAVENRVIARVADALRDLVRSLGVMPYDTGIESALGQLADRLEDNNTKDND